MLIMYEMDKPSKWEYYLHLVEFSYNNGYQTSLKMIPFEALYVLHIIFVTPVITNDMCIAYFSVP
jgi:hypothetical protein